MMNKQFNKLKVYSLGGGIAFQEFDATIPFLVLPTGQATIKPWGSSGFLFENILTGDVIAFVAFYDNIVDSTATPYGVDQISVFTALAGFFFDLGGGGASDLATVLGFGNSSGANDIDFDLGQGLVFDNGSRLREGTIDALLGGNKGIAQICGLGYELKWEGGVLYVMGSSGNTIRWSLYNFTNVPTVNEDNTKGYTFGSLWSLDDGTIYRCADATTGAAVWVLQSNAVPTLSQVLASGKSANNSAIIDLRNLDFETTAGHTVAAGELAWNDSLGTLNLGLKGGNTISNVGQHIHARVVNKTVPLVGLTKAGYQVVIVSGATGQRLSVKLAKADNDINSAGTLGVVCENIAGNQEGFICSVGQITNINTTGSLQGETWADGDSLYLSGTTFGAITNVKPSAPIHEVRIGYVEYAHAVNGKIYVKIDNGYELDELHNVSINPLTLANNDALIYESSTQLWKNKTIATALGFTPTTNARNITINGTTQNLSADRTYTVTDANLSTSDITTNDVSTTKHGFAPKAPNDTTKFLRGDGTWAAPTIADPAGWTYIVKSANQDVTNSATLVDDTDLQFSVVAGGQYMIELDAVIASSSTVADYKSAFAVSAGTMKGLGIVTNNSTGSIAQVFNITAGAAAVTNSVGSGISVNDLDYLLSIKIIYSFTASSNAIFKFQFAQNTATAATTARTFKGSILKYKKIN